MNYSDDLKQDLAAYHLLKTEEEKRAFLASLRTKIALMEPEERRAHLKAIADEVQQIAQRVDAQQSEAI